MEIPYPVRTEKVFIAGKQNIDSHGRSVQVITEETPVILETEFKTE